MTYDYWKTSPPEPMYGNQILICTVCGEHVYGDVEDLEGTIHCQDEDDSNGFHGYLTFDDGWVWDASDDPQFEY